MSTESERAAYYEAHKDDPAEWGEPMPTPAKPRRRLASMISVRLAPDELAVVREGADERGLSVSGFLRMAALREARHGTGGTPLRNPITLLAPSSITSSDLAVTVLSVVGSQDVEKAGATGIAADGATAVRR
jgi:hypothetical protein